MWATVSSLSCFHWLYRASPSLAAKNIINLISVLTIWWCPCVESSFVLLEEGVCYDQCVLLANSISLCHASFHIPRLYLPVTPGVSWLETGVSLTECGPLEKGMANHFSILALRTPWTVMKRQNDRIPKEELPRSVGAQYATGDQWRNNFRKNEGMEPKQKQYPVVDVTDDRSKIWCCKE